MDACTGVGPAVAMAARTLAVATAVPIPLSIAVAVAVEVAVATTTSTTMASQGKEIFRRGQASFGRQRSEGTYPAWMFVPEPLSTYQRTLKLSLLHISLSYMAGLDLLLVLHAIVFCLGETRCPFVMFPVAHAHSYTALIYSGTPPPPFV